MDTLRSYYYVSTIPQDLSPLYPPSYQFFDGQEGKYFICERDYYDTIFIEIFFNWGGGACTCKDYPIQWTLYFALTMLSPDSMFLEGYWEGGFIAVTRFLFIRRTFNF